MKLFFTLLLILASLSVKAATENENVIVMKAPQNTVYEGTSAANRIGKSYSIAGQLIGIGPSLVPSSGLALSYFINRNLLVEIEGTSGSIRGGGSLDYSKLSSQSFGVHMKKFVSNSFYYRVGLDHLQVKTDPHVYSRTTVYPAFSPSYVESEEIGQFDGSMTGATLVIGNQWQWDSFTLGCDWIGYTAPITSKANIASNGEYAQKRATEDVQSWIKDGKVHALRFYLGASF